MKVLLAAALIVLGATPGCGKKKKTTTAAPAAPSLTIKAAGTKAATAALVSDGTPVGSPTTMKLGLYSISISANEDCTGAISVGDNGATAVSEDFLAGPTLFTGTPANGTYKCLIIKMQDVIKFKPDQAAVAAWTGDCTDTSTEYAFDIYRDGDTTFHDPTGTAITGHGSDTVPVSDTVYIYASTSEAAVQAGAIKADPGQTVTLATPLVVPGTTTMYADASNQVIGKAGGICKFEGVLFGFK